jgi:hypothetical protein
MPVGDKLSALPAGRASLVASIVPGYEVFSPISPRSALAVLYAHRVARGLPTNGARTRDSAAVEPSAAGRTGDPGNADADKPRRVRAAGVWPCHAHAKSQVR